MGMAMSMERELCGLLPNHNPLTTTEVKQVQDFANASKPMLRAGSDGVELHEPP